MQGSSIRKRLLALDGWIEEQKNTIQEHVSEVTKQLQDVCAANYGHEWSKWQYETSDSTAPTGYSSYFIRRCEICRRSEISDSKPDELDYEPIHTNRMFLI